MRVSVGSRSIPRPADPVSADDLYRRSRRMELQGGVNEALILLQRAAGLGHVEAMTYLGLRQLIGYAAPVDLEAAARLLAGAAERGGAIAAEAASVTAGLGLGRAQDWNAAFDFLEAGARLGDWRSRAELALLTDDAEAATRLEGGETATDWVSRARRGVDLDGWLSPPPGKPICDSPRIEVFEGFIPVAACRWICERARGKTAPARIYDHAIGGGRPDASRTNMTADFGLSQLDLILLLVRARIARAAGVEPPFLEQANVLHYSPGERFVTHVDYLDANNPALAGDMRTLGQRTITFLIYLNDGFEDGETFFPEAKLKYKGRAGDAVMFFNILPSGETDFCSRHAGLPPSSGEKWLFSQWIRDRAQPVVPATGAARG